MPVLTSNTLARTVRWLDSHALLIISSILLVFIPLFPKIPFFSPIEQYIVRVRLEDILVFLSALAWGIQLYRGKIRVGSPLNKLIGAYILVSFLSLISALLITHTIPFIPIHILKSVLHWFRYIEYFSLFFIVFAAIRSRQDVIILLSVIVSSVIGVSVYGFGQKYFYWPVYSTMNREFSKGIRLYLTEHARVQSTFAGHYDLAAYLVVLLPLILALALGNSQKKLSLGLFLTHFVGVWLLIVSASRTSLAAYSVAITIVIFLYALQRTTVMHKLVYFFSRFISIWFVIMLLLLTFGHDVIERFGQVANLVPPVGRTFTAVDDYSQQLMSSIKIADQSLLEHTNGPTGNPPPESLSTSEAAVLVPSDQQPSTQRPADVYEDIPDIAWVATTSADGTKTIVEIEKPRTWSQNAQKYGLSLGIRLDTLWPQALAGFERNPLFGSGYATLNKQELTEFTIAESTDNNYLRTLGETGFLGFITFYGTVIVSLTLAIRSLSSSDSLLKTIAIGYCGATIGLLLNATYIDVFAASKVAFTFWSLTGIFVGYYMIETKKENRSTHA